jgi:membrane protein implicated in regulation of membrane protease activity
MGAWVVYNILTTLAEEIAIAVVGLWLLPRLGVQIPSWAVALAMAAWLGWSVFTFHKGRGALNRRPADVIGAQGYAVTRLDPEGQVKVQGEIWRARTAAGAIDVGAKVLVVSRQRLTLVVRAAGSGERPAGPVQDGDGDQYKAHSGDDQAEHLERPESGRLEPR